MRYGDFIEAKSQLNTADGFEPLWLPSDLFDFQAALVEWAIRQGRAALFADCGLGKTLMQLVWAQNVVEHTNGCVLILTPLAVASQTRDEARKFNIDVHLCNDGQPKPGINITNYEKLHYFSASKFSGVVCDESAILKSFDGVRRLEITEFMKKMRYRLLCTATPSPNEYIELGTSSEALGNLGYMDMLTRFFKNNHGNSIKATVIRHSGKNHKALDENAKWRFKGYAEPHFWRWVSSWARAVRKPSDLGFDDGRFQLPPLIQREHLVKSSALPEGWLFERRAVGLSEQREERRRTLHERCERAAAIVNERSDASIVWCNLNDEGDVIERMIKDCVQISGKDDDNLKETKFNRFLSGDARVLVIKPKIGAWGLNFQHCCHMVTFPTHSFEQDYQSIRRCWRFGQTQPVERDIVATEGDAEVLANLQRKSAAADKMFADLVAHMNQAANINRVNQFTKQGATPEWLM